MSKKIFSGVQPTGNLHLGNYIGAIKNFVSLQNDPNNFCIYCVVDLHAITVKQNPSELKKNIRETAAAFIASGLDSKKSIIFNQSLVSAHSEGSWLLSCVARMGWLNRMTQFKEKAGKDKEKASVGLYIYPILMAADILLYDANIVPVGKDQLQHLEITRSIASRFNNHFGDTFVTPKAELEKNSSYVIGTDGNKMSKSKDNIIDIFQDDNLLMKQVMRIKTESTAIDEPKNPKNCNVFKIFSLIASEKDINILKKRYYSGDVGFCEAK